MKRLKEILTEDIKKFTAWRDHTKSFKPQVRTFIGKNNKKYDISVEKASTGSQYYKVHHKGEEVGSFYVRTGGGAPLNLNVANAQVNPEHQRQGIASQVYDHIEKDTNHLGLSLLPQGKWETSPDAKAFWKNRNPDKHKLIESAQVIQFKPKTAKPPPTTITSEDALSQLSTIVGNKKNAWSHPSIRSPMQSSEHSLHDLAHYIGGTYQSIYGNVADNHQAIGKFNEAKQKAKRVVKDHKEDIHTHLSDTIGNLERLAIKVRNSDNKHLGMNSVVKVHNELARWKRTQEALHSVE